jgi:hypothetical protein
MRALILALLVLTESAFAVPRGVISPQITTADSAIYSSVPCCSPAPANGMAFLMNNFGRGNLVNGVDYQTRFFASQNQFPVNSTLTWNWAPTMTCTGCGAFAYGWPEISYGSSNFGSSWPVTGPWPEQLSALTTLTVTYNLAVGGNTNSYDVLLDTFVTASPTTTDGSYVAEVSFYPYGNPNLPLTNASTFHAFTSAGNACVGTNFGSPPELVIYPIVGTSCTVSPVRRSILSGTVDLKEIFTYLIAQGLLTGSEYLRGYGLGPEMQVPAAWNSAPYSGTLTVNGLSFNWQ